MEKEGERRAILGPPRTGSSRISNRRSSFKSQDHQKENTTTYRIIAADEERKERTFYCRRRMDLVLMIVTCKVKL